MGTLTPVTGLTPTEAHGASLAVSGSNAAREGLAYVPQNPGKGSHIVLFTHARKAPV